MRRARAHVHCSSSVVLPCILSSYQWQRIESGWIVSLVNSCRSMNHVFLLRRINVYSACKSSRRVGIRVNKLPFGVSVDNWILIAIITTDAMLREMTVYLLVEQCGLKGSHANNTLDNSGEAKFLTSMPTCDLG